MAKSAVKQSATKSTPAAVKPKQPTRQELNQLLLCAAEQADRANAQIVALRDERDDCYRAAARWREAFQQLHAQSQLEIEEALERARAAADNNVVLRRELAKVTEVNRRLVMFQHTAMVALQTTQAAAGLDAYKTLEQAVG
jgi:hypothetical protein